MVGGAPGKLAAKLATEDESTATSLAVVADAAHVAVLDAELAGVLADRREVER